MQAIENAAAVSIGRAYGFAWLAIICVMFAFSFQPPMAAFIGGVLCISLTLILGGCAWFTRFKPYNRTELWLILPKEERPPISIAQRVIGQVLKDTYLWFAKQAAVFSIIFLALGVALQLLGLHELPGSKQTYSDNVMRPIPAILVPAAEPGEDGRKAIYP